MILHVRFQRVWVLVIKVFSAGFEKIIFGFLVFDPGGCFITHNLCAFLFEENFNMETFQRLSLFINICSLSSDNSKSCQTDLK